jgi:hypothetical protein
MAERAAPAQTGPSGGGDGGEGRVPASVAPSGRAIPPRPRKKTKRSR